MKIMLMSDGEVGQKITLWLLENYPNDVALIITAAENEIFNACVAKGIPSFVYDSETRLLEILAQFPQCEMGFLCWWPRLVSGKVINSLPKGFVNTHPSLLPQNRGKHFNFWALVEQSSFGVSLHAVDEGIDSGDIIAQLPISYDWEDSGESLYLRAKDKMVDLFLQTYPYLRVGKFSRYPQDLINGSLHFASEIDSASHIELDKYYKARDLLNLLRARSFSGHPSCWFNDYGNIFEVSIKIKRKLK